MSLLEQAAEAGFKLEEIHFSGGSSQVYRAVEISTGNTVAFKYLSQNANAERVNREASILSRISHPAIAVYCGSGLIDGRAYLATQWIYGTPLHSTFTESQSCSTDSALVIFKQLSDALQVAHNSGVAHGDISPSNILVDDQLKITLIDFGLSREPDDVTVTAHGDLAGTPRYLAPEVIRGEDPSAASDQYSAAIVLYELLARRWPFSETVTVATALHHQLQSTPDPLIEVNPAVPLALSNAVDKALCKDPDLRHSSMSAFVQAIEQKGTYSNRKRNWQSAWIVPCVAAGASFVGLAYAMSMQHSDNVSGDKSGHAVPMMEMAGCNLLPNPEFETPLKDNFYPDENNVGRITLVPKAGKNNSQAIQIGLEKEYGLYGRLVPVKKNQTYAISLWVKHVGQLFDLHVRVEWVDKDWQRIDENLTVYPLAEVSEGTHVFTDAIAPANAAYAVPTLYKDGSPGYLLVDEFYFFPVDDDCAKQK